MNLVSIAWRRLGLVVALLACSLPVPAADKADDRKPKDLALKGDAVCTRCHDETESYPVLAIAKTRHGTVADGRAPTCTSCCSIDTSDPCTLCRDPRRDTSILVVVETVADLWALERANVLNAAYHVLGGVLSPLDGVGPRDLNIEALMVRAASGAVREIIIALNATVDGQTTAHYLTDLLAPLGLKVTRLAHGVPVGGELDYLDEGTLAAALRSRTAM